jgi:hypothetical protein
MSESLPLLKTAMDMYQAQYTATDKLWAYFSAVSLALVAYTISSGKVLSVFPEAVTAVAAYLTFCIGNFSALSAAQEQLVALAKIVRTQGKLHDLNEKNFRVFSSAEVARFYWLVVAVIVGATIGLAWYRA